VARAFKRRGGRFVARLDDGEREVVLGLLEQTRELLAPAPRELTGDAFEDLVSSLGLQRLKDLDEDLAPEPRDPALERLLPSAHREDPALAAEFRRLTEYGLRDRKATNIAKTISAIQDSDGEKVKLDREHAEAMVVALTDVRLLLGERLGLRTDDDAEDLQGRLEGVSQDDPRLYLATCYDFLTWLQESLVQALMGM
jgi:hypothetical protein